MLAVQLAQTPTPFSRSCLGRGVGRHPLLSRHCWGPLLTKLATLLFLNFSNRQNPHSASAQPPTNQPHFFLPLTHIRYVSGDTRFSSRYCKGNPRKMVRTWAEKEMRNLHRLKAAGIRCPVPRELRSHVLVMDFIGEQGVAAPRLKVHAGEGSNGGGCYRPFMEKEVGHCTSGKQRLALCL